MNGLKTAVCVTVVPSIKAQPNITFEECQALMVEMDKLLQQANQNTTAASTSQSSHSSNRGRNTAPSSTPGASGSTPVKTEAAKNIVRLTPEERDRLWKIGTCFCCHQTSHMSRDCPVFPHSPHAWPPWTLLQLLLPRLLSPPLLLLQLLLLLPCPRFPLLRTLM